jgi:hypothetical protein
VLRETTQLRYNATDNPAPRCAASLRSPPRAANISDHQRCERAVMNSLQLFTVTVYHAYEPRNPYISIRIGLPELDCTTS